MEVSQGLASEHNPDSCSSTSIVQLEDISGTSNLPEPTVLGVLVNGDHDYLDEDFMDHPVKRPSIIPEENEEDLATCPSPLMEEHRVTLRFDQSDNADKQIEHKRRRTELKAQVVSLLCIIVSLMVGIRLVIVGISGGALAVFGLAGETLLDILVCMMVIWRYRKVRLIESDDAEEALLQLRKQDIYREHRCTLWIGASFFGFAVMLFITGLVHLLHEWADAQKEHRATRDTLIVVWPAFVVYAVFSMVKVRLANELDSKTLRQAAVCSIFQAIISVVIGLASLLELLLATEEDDDIDAYTVIDPVTTFFIAAFICGQGLLMIASNAAALQDHIELA